MADTGDLLLFKSRAGIAKGVRAVTGGDFDHVAMILRFNCDDGDNDVYFVESSGNIGVAVNKWSIIR